MQPFEKTILSFVLLLGGLTLQLHAQTIKERSYAYGVQIARGLQYQGFKGDECSPTHFVKGFKAGLENDPATTAQARHQICLLLSNPKRTVTGPNAYNMAHTQGMVVSGTIAPYVKNPSKEFNYKALKKGVEDWVYQKKRRISDEKTLEIYINYTRELERRRIEQMLNPSSVSHLFQQDLLHRRNRSYALGVQSATILASVNKEQKEVLDATAFTEGVKAALKANMEELIQSEIIKENYFVHGMLPTEPKELSYHIGRSLFYIPVHTIDGMVYQLDFASLKKGFQTIVHEKEPRFSEREIKEQTEPFLEQLLREVQQRQPVLPPYEKWTLKYLPRGEAETVIWADPIEKCSYALGIWAVEILGKDMNLPPSAIHAESWWRGIQAGQTLSDREYKVLFRLMQHYNQKGHLPIHLPDISYDAGRFILGHLVGYIGIGAHLSPKDLQEAAFRKGLEATKNGQALDLTRYTVHRIVDDYRILVLDRLLLVKEPTPSAKKMRLNLSYAFGVKLAQYTKRSIQLKENQSMDQVLRGLCDAVEDSRLLYDEVPDILNHYHRSGEVLGKEPLAYYLGVKSLGELTFWEPLPYHALDIETFRKGYQAVYQGTTLDLKEYEIYSLFETYKAHLRRRKDQLLRAANVEQR